MVRLYQQQNKYSLKLKISNVKAHYFTNEIQKILIPACLKMHPDNDQRKGRNIKNFTNLH